MVQITDVLTMIVYSAAAADAERQPDHIYRHSVQPMQSKVQTIRAPKQTDGRGDMPRVDVDFVHAGGRVRGRQQPDRAAKAVHPMSPSVDVHVGLLHDFADRQPGRYP